MFEFYTRTECCIFMSKPNACVSAQGVLFQSFTSRARTVWLTSLTIPFQVPSPTSEIKCLPLKVPSVSTTATHLGWRRGRRCHDRADSALESPRLQSSPLNGSVCTRRVMTKQPPVRIRTWVLLHSLLATSISHSYLRFRPWTKIPTGRNGGTAFSHR